jgi:glycosyltransferase involved in cell wall biosynthesis
MTPKISIVVPLFDEAGNVVPLVTAIQDAMVDMGTWELLMVDDGSRDGTAAEIRRLAGVDPRIRLIRLARNYGQTTALQAGFDESQGEIVVSIDGDLQNDPADIPRLVHELEAGGFDLVAGYRQGRQDSARRKLPSALGNAVARLLTGVQIRDTGCTLRAYRRELLEGFVIYSDLHRFVPAIAAAVKGARITEIPVGHSPRLHGSSKYGLSRAPKVAADLLVLTLIRSFRERPLVMFAGGSLLAFLGALLFTIPAVLALFNRQAPLGIILPSLPLVWVELACYLLLLGLIGEVVLRGHRFNRRSTPILTRLRS